jgi:hypothetical protein
VGAAGGVDVQRDRGRGVIGVEVKELGDSEVGYLLLDRLAQEDDRSLSRRE